MQRLADLERATAKANRVPKSGVGMLLTDARPHPVASLVQGAPAALSGMIEMGDVLWEIDGRAVDKQPLSAIKTLLLGEPNTQVCLLMQKKGDPNPKAPRAPATGSTSKPCTTFQSLDPRKKVAFLASSGCYHDM